MKLLFRSYRIDQYTDPDGFMQTIGMVLEQYPIETIKFVTDPRTGAQRRHEWPPSVKNMVDECDRHIRETANANRYKNWGKPNTLAIEGPKEPKPTLDELKAKYGPNWGITDPGNERIAADEKPVPTWERIAEAYHGDANAMKRLTAPWMTRDGAKNSE